MNLKQCYFCTSNISNVDYKDAQTLFRFMDPQSRILPRRRSGNRVRGGARALAASWEFCLSPRVKNARNQIFTVTITFPD